MTRRLSIIFLILAPTCWSLAGVFVRVSTWDPWVFAGWRSIFSALTMWLVFKLLYPKTYRFDWSWSNLSIALFYSVFSTLYTISLRYTSIANASVLVYTGIIYVAFLSPVILKEKSPKSDFIFIGLIILGISLFFLNDLKMDEGRNDLLGIAAGAGSGFCWALYVMYMRKKGQTDEPPLSTMVIANFMTPIYCGLAMFNAGIGEFSAFSQNLWQAALYGIGPVGIGYVFYVLSFKRVTALEASLIPAIEPILNAVWAFLAIKEVPGIWSIIGGLIVLGAVFVRGWLAVRQPAGQLAESS